jgi:hypothetical protein
MTDKYKALEENYKRLKAMFKKEISDRIVIEVKLNKNAIHRELLENARAINENVFFEQKRSKLASLNNTLLANVITNLLTYYYIYR